MSRSWPHASLRQLALIGCGLGIEGWALLALAELPGANIPRHVALTLTAFVVYLVAVRMVLAASGTGRRGDLAIIFGVAVLVRATLLSAPPSLSDDIYRAVWDARITHAGINPYDYAPSAPQLAPFRDDDIWPRINHKDQRTPYPPLAEILGAAAYWVLPERLLGMQALAALMDLVCAGLLGWLLQRCGQDARRCLVVAWSPIGALHFAHSGHNDASMIALFLASAVALSFGRGWLSLGGLGLATAVKAVPALAVPAFARATGPLPVLAWAAAGVAMTLPFVGAGAGLIAGISSETGQRFNESAHLVVERAASGVAPGQAGAIAAVVGVAIVVGAAVLSTLRGDPTPAGALVGGSRVMAAYLLVAPVVQPWYLTWLAPMTAFRLQPGAGGLPFALNDALAWLWLAGLATLTELTYLPQGSALWAPLRVVEYGPAYALLCAAAFRWWRSRER